MTGVDDISGLGSSSVPAGSTAIKPRPDTLTDDELLNLARAGDRDAYAELYQRYRQLALSVAWTLTHQSSMAEDVVAEAFLRVFRTLKGGGHGPRDAFKPYLLTTVKHVAYDTTKRNQRIQLSDDVEVFDKPHEEKDRAVLSFERTAISEALAALPERWRQIIWLTEVEGISTVEVSERIGLSANATAALAYRAREGLRQAYLQAHLKSTDEPQCKYTRDRLGALARDKISRRERLKVTTHLETCADCTALAHEVQDVGRGMPRLAAGILLFTPFGAGAFSSFVRPEHASAMAAANSTSTLPPSGPAPHPGGSLVRKAIGGTSRSGRLLLTLPAAAAVVGIIVAVASSAGPRAHVTAQQFPDQRSLGVLAASAGGTPPAVQPSPTASRSAHASTHPPSATSTSPATQSRPVVAPSTPAVVLPPPATVGAPPPPAPNLVVDGAFERPYVTGTAFAGFTEYCVSPTNYCATPTSHLGAWTLLSGSVDILNKAAGNYGAPSAAGAQAQPLDLSGSAPGEIDQVLTTAPGATYTITYYLSANNDCPTETTTKHLEVLANNWVVSAPSVSAVGVTRADPRWSLQHASFTATGAQTTLGFRALDAGSCGPMLSGIVVKRTA